MDGLSVAASGLAVVSITVQLAESVKKICDFWKSIEEAPEEIRELASESDLLLSVLGQVASEAQHVDPDAAFIAAMESCSIKVKHLCTLIRKLEPGFSSSSSRTLRWTAMKAVLKMGEVKKFKKGLESAKLTLVMAQQNQVSRLSRFQYRSIVESLSRLNVEHSGGAYLGMPCKVNTCHYQNKSPPKVDFRLSQDDDTSLQRYTHEPRPFKETLNDETAIVRCFLGTVRVRTRETRVENYESSSDQGQWENESKFTVYPAQWLTRLGFRCGLHFVQSVSSVKGWKNTLQTFRPVPDNSLIFKLCEEGNTSAVKELFSRGWASVRDTDSQGYTPLHFAAEFHRAELCQFLKDAAADTSAVTHDWKITPVELAAFGTNTLSYQTLREARNTLRILADSLDFSDNFSNGYRVLKALSDTVDYLGRQSEAQADLYVWMIKFSSFEIKKLCDVTTQHILLFNTLSSTCGTQKAADFLWDLVSVDFLDYSVFMYWLVMGGREMDRVSFLLAKGMNPHRLDLRAMSTERNESPTSLAMYALRIQQIWLHGLSIGGVHLEDFVDQELKENHDLYPGWQKSTLLEALTYSQHCVPLESWKFPNWSCDDCTQDQAQSTLWFMQVQPYWRHRLERIKHGINPENPDQNGREEIQITSTNLQGASEATYLAHQAESLNNSNHLDLEESLATELDVHAYPPTVSIRSDCIYAANEIICAKCWLHYLQTGTRRKTSSLDEDSISDDEPSEDEYSPYLIHA